MPATYTTLSGRISTDPYFNRSVDGGWHELSVDINNATPDGHDDLEFSYRAIIEYNDFGDHRVLRFAIRKKRSGEDLRRSRPAQYRALTAGVPFDDAMRVLCDLHFNGDLGQSEMRAEIEVDQSRRDDEYDLATA